MTEERQVWIDANHITVDVDQYNEMILAMLRQQHKLDGVVIGNLLSNPNKSGKEISQLTAIRVEAGEGIDHYDYKWWKFGSPKIDLTFGEVIDIIHFTLSNILGEYCKSVLKGSYKEKYSEIKSISTIYHPNRLESYDDRYVADLNYNIYNDDDVIALFEHIILATYNSPSSSINLIILDLCFTIASKLGFNDTDVYKHYMGKCALNHFRANNGYGTTYIKVWADSREDNEHLTDIINSLKDVDDMGVENIMFLLETKYHEVNFN